MSSKKIIRSISALSIGTVVARFFGLGREIATANFFGTTLVYDAFLIAFMIPNFFRGILAEGALNNAFIPVFTGYASEPDRKEEGLKVYGICFTLSLVITLALFVIVFAGSFLLQNLTAEGSKWYWVWYLLRFTFPYLVLISLTALNAGVLNAYKVFLLPSLSPVMLDIFWVASLFFLAPIFGSALEDRILGLCLGVIAGGLGQFLFTFFPVFKRGYRARLDFNFSHPAVRRIVKLLAPVVIGVAVVPVNLLVDYSLAGLLYEGAVSGLWYSTRLFQLPLGIFAISIATAILPWFSENIAGKRYDEFRQNLFLCLKMLMLLMLPFTFGLIVFRSEIVSMLFMRGVFDADSVFLVAYPLVFYSLGLIGYGGVSVMSRAFYAAGDTVTPVKVGAASIISNLLLNLVLMRFFQHGGIAFSTALVGIANFLILVSLFNRKHFPINIRRLDRFFVKAVAASAIMGFLAFFFNAGISAFTDLSLPAALFAGIIFSVFVYLLAVRIIFLGDKELKTIWRRYRF